MTQPVVTLVVACISAAFSIFSLVAGYFVNRNFEQFKIRLAASQAATERAEDAQRLVAKYRDPLLRTAYDFQSRLYNLLRPGGFRGGNDPEYFRLNTLFVLAEFFGWLEIIRRDMQFLDIGAVHETKKLNARIWKIQECFINLTPDYPDALHIYRGQQRAIGELMIAPVESKMGGPAPRYVTIGYAEFATRMEDSNYSKWFERFGNQLSALPEEGSPRLAKVQHALMDLIDMLDPNWQWYSSDRERVQPPPAGCGCSECSST